MGVKIVRRYYKLKMLDGWHVFRADRFDPNEIYVDMGSFETEDEAQAVLNEMASSLPYDKVEEIIVEVINED